MPDSEIKIGFLNFHPYGAIIAVACLAGLLLAKKRASQYKINASFFDDLLFIIPLIFTIAGARTYHVLDYWQIYSKNPASIFFIQNGGLGIWGALAGLIVGIYILCRIRQIKFLTVLDTIAPSVSLGQAIGRVGNYINQEGFGQPTEKMWGVFIKLENRPPEYAHFSRFHPTFFYEAILNLIIMAIILLISKRVKTPGHLFAIYLILYSSARLVLETWRIDTWTIGTVKIAQIISILTITVSLLFLRSSKNNPRNG